MNFANRQNGTTASPTSHLPLSLIPCLPFVLHILQSRLFTVINLCMFTHTWNIFHCIYAMFFDRQRPMKLQNSTTADEYTRVCLVISSNVSLVFRFVFVSHLYLCSFVIERINVDVSVCVRVWHKCELFIILINKFALQIPPKSAKVELD